MKLVNVLALTSAKLINEPFINSFENIVFDVKKVKRGDLFAAFEEEDIEEAVLNGAYGIIFEKPAQMSDSEIAWIKVDSLENALKKLLRFRLIEKNITSYECDEIVLKLAQQVLTPWNFITISGEIKDIFSMLWSIEDSVTILFSSKLCDADIFTDVKEIPRSSDKHIDIVEQTLFETSFIYDNTFYERQLISPFFIPYLERLLNLYKTLNINFRLKRFNLIDHFEAVFVNNHFEIKEFGTSDKVLIFEPDSALLDSQIDFLCQNANWAKIVYLLPSDYENSYKDIPNIYIYKNENEIVNILKDAGFHFALIGGVDKSILKTPIKEQPQLTLF